jgi:SAM-dependent MidA family methyltransferase
MHSLPSPPPAPLRQAISQVIAQAGGWLGFDAFMALALYAPGWGYYSGGRRKFGLLPQSGSDFVTAPELSPHFGRALAQQVAQALAATGTDEVWEFGAGSGALARQLLGRLDASQLRRYVIVELSGSLVERQKEQLAEFADRVQWLKELPASLSAVVVGNEVLDAMPVQLLVRKAGVWHERGVACSADALVWQDRPTDLRPPVEVAGVHDYLTEVHAQAQAWVRTLAQRMARGAAFLIDYGFPEAEFFHPQRDTGTLACHHLHRMDADPLEDAGDKDITAHVNFTGVALAAQEVPGFGVLGYTSQARFLLNCGLLSLLEGASLAERTMAQKLLILASSWPTCWCFQLNRLRPTVFQLTP